MIAALRRLIEAMKKRTQAPIMLANVAEAWLEQGVTESAGSNAGPDVSWFIHDGGGNPTNTPPWCAYFVSSCCRQVERTGADIAYVMTGRAVSHWMKAPESRRIDAADIWTCPEPRGTIFVRTRLSKPASEADKVRAGQSRQGHTGIVTAVDSESTPRTITCVAGNSSGYGHSRVSGGGAVAMEVISEGDAAWNRLVGFVRVTGHGEEEA